MLKTPKTFFTAAAMVACLGFGSVTLTGCSPEEQAEIDLNEAKDNMDAVRDNVADGDMEDARDDLEDAKADLEEGKANLREAAQDGPVGVGVDEDGDVEVEEVE